MDTPFSLKGKVDDGHKRGRKLGFPTINIKATPDIEEGIYISRIKFDEKIYNSITFIGRAITFNESEFKAETYILDFDIDIYGKGVEVIILKKLRENTKFKSEKELIKQMKIDKKQTIEYFKNL